MLPPAPRASLAQPQGETPAGPPVSVAKRRAAPQDQVPQQRLFVTENLAFYLFPDWSARLILTDPSQRIFALWLLTETREPAGGCGMKAPRARTPASGGHPHGSLVTPAPSPGLPGSRRCPPGTNVAPTCSKDS